MDALTAEAILERHQLRSVGAPLDRAKAVVVAVHGRGVDAASILSLAPVLAQPDVAFVAPQARNGVWYPHAFIAPVAANEPWLSQSLAQVSAVLEALWDAGVPDGLIGLMGFSQGACLAMESVLRRPRGYGAVLVFSGGYIGPMGPQREPSGSLEGARILLGCSDVDPHIPLQRFRETSVLAQAMGAKVTERIYPGFGHAINDDEIAIARGMLGSMVDPSA